jgi:transportin-3
MDYQPEILIPSSCFHQSFPLVLTCLEFVDPEPVFTSLNYVRQILGHSSLELQAAASSSSGAGGKPGSTTNKPGSNQMAVPVAPAGYDVFAQSINQVVSQNGYLLSEVLLRRTLTDFPEDSLSTVIILFRLLADFFPTQLATWVPSVVERLSPKVATIPDREKFLVAFKQLVLSLFLFSR